MAEHLGLDPRDPRSLEAVRDVCSDDVFVRLVAGTAIFLEQNTGVVNDGLVTAESAKWGTFMQCVPADHLKEVGQVGALANGFDHLQFYRDVTARVRAAGF